MAQVGNKLSQDAARQSVSRSISQPASQSRARAREPACLRAVCVARWTSENRIVVRWFHLRLLGRRAGRRPPRFDSIPFRLPHPQWRVGGVSQGCMGQHAPIIISSERASEPRACLSACLPASERDRPTPQRLAASVRPPVAPRGQHCRTLGSCGQSTVIRSPSMKSQRVVCAFGLTLWSVWASGDHPNRMA